MQRRRAGVVVLLATLSLPFVVGLPVSVARTRKPAIEKTEEVPVRAMPNFETELAPLRQQLEEFQQITRTLRNQVEDQRGAAQALAAQLAERRAAEDALAAQLAQLRQDVQRQQQLLSETLSAVVVLGAGLLGVGWLLRRRGAIQDREAILQEMRIALRGHLLTMQNQRESDVAARQKVEEELERVRYDLATLTARTAPPGESAD